MGRRLAPLTLDTLPDLPDPCRQCVMLGARARRRRPGRARPGTPAFEKEAWVSATLLEWGSCGRVAYVDDDAGRASCMYAPPKFVPRGRWPSRPPPSARTPSC